MALPKKEDKNKQSKPIIRGLLKPSGDGNPVTQGSIVAGFEAVEQMIALSSGAAFFGTENVKTVQQLSNTAKAKNSVFGNLANIYNELTSTIRPIIQETTKAVIDNSSKLEIFNKPESVTNTLLNQIKEAISNIDPVVIPAEETYKSKANKLTLDIKNSKDFAELLEQAKSITKEDAANVVALTTAIESLSKIDTKPLSDSFDNLTCIAVSFNDLNEAIKNLQSVDLSKVFENFHENIKELNISLVEVQKSFEDNKEVFENIKKLSKTLKSIKADDIKASILAITKTFTSLDELKQVLKDDVASPIVDAINAQNKKFDSIKELLEASNTTTQNIASNIEKQTEYFKKLEEFYKNSVHTAAVAASGAAEDVELIEQATDKTQETVVKGSNLDDTAIDEAISKYEQLGAFIITAAMTMLLGGLLFALFPKLFEGTILFTIALGSFIGSVGLILVGLNALAKKLDVGLTVASSLAGFIAVMSGVMLIGALFVNVGGGKYVSSAILFGVALSTFLLTVAVPIRFIGLLVNKKNFDNTVSLGVLIALLAGVMMVGAYVVSNEKLVENAMRFGVVLSQFLLLTLLPTIVILPFLKKAEGTLAEIGLLIAVSAAVMMLGAYIVKDDEFRKNALQFGIVLSQFLIGTLLPFVFVGAFMRVAKDQIDAVRNFILVSAGIMLLGAWFMSGAEGQQRASNAIGFGVLLGTFMFSTLLPFVLFKNKIQEGAKYALMFGGFLTICTALVWIGSQLFEKYGWAPIKSALVLAAYTGILAVVCKYMGKNSTHIFKGSLAAGTMAVAITMLSAGIYIAGQAAHNTKFSDIFNFLGMTALVVGAVALLALVSTALAPATAVAAFLGLAIAAIAGSLLLINLAAGVVTTDTILEFGSLISAVIYNVLTPLSENLGIVLLGTVGAIALGVAGIFLGIAIGGLYLVSVLAKKAEHMVPALTNFFGTANGERIGIIGLMADLTENIGWIAGGMASSFLLMLGGAFLMGAAVALAAVVGISNIISEEDITAVYTFFGDYTKGGEAKGMLGVFGVLTQNIGWIAAGMASSILLFIGAACLMASTVCIIGVLKIAEASLVHLPAIQKFLGKYDEKSAEGIIGAFGVLGDNMKVITIGMTSSILLCLGGVFLLGAAASLKSAMSSMAELYKIMNTFKSNEADFTRITSLMSNLTDAINTISILDLTESCVKAAMINNVVTSISESTATIMRAISAMSKMQVVTAWDKNGMPTAFEVLSDKERDDAKKNIINILTDFITAVNEAEINEDVVEKAEYITGVSREIAKSVGYIARSLSYYASSKIATEWDKNGNPIKFIKFEEADKLAAIDNIKTIIVSLVQGIGEAVNTPVNGVVISDMFTSDGWFRNNSTFATAIDGIRGLGPVISSIATGLQNYAKLMIATDWDSKGNPIKFTKMGVEDFNKAGSNIATVISCMVKGIAKLLNEKVEGGECTYKDLFKDGWFTKSTFGQFFNGIKDLGQLISGVAYGVQAFASMSIPTEYDEAGVPIKFKTLTNTDIKNAGNTVGMVVTTLIDALLKKHDEYGGMFKEITKYHENGNISSTEKSPALVMIEGVKSLGLALGSVANGVASFAKGIPSGFDKDGKPTGFVDLRNCADKIAENIGNVITLLITSIINAGNTDINGQKAVDYFKEVETVVEEGLFSSKTTTTDSAFITMIKGVGLLGDTLGKVATGVAAFSTTIPTEIDPETGKVKKSVSIDYNAIAKNIGTVLSSLVTSIADVEPTVTSKLDTASKVIEAATGVSEMLSPIAETLTKYAELRIPSGFDKDGKPTGFITLSDDDFKTVGENIGALVSTLVTSIASIKLDDSYKANLSNLKDNVLPDINSALSTFADVTLKMSELKIVNEIDPTTGKPKSYTKLTEQNFKAVNDNVTKLLSSIPESIKTTFEKNKSTFESLTSILDTASKTFDSIYTYLNDIAKVIVDLSASSYIRELNNPKSTEVFTQIEQLTDVISNANISELAKALNKLNSDAGNNAKPHTYGIEAFLSTVSNTINTINQEISKDTNISTSVDNLIGFKKNFNNFSRELRYVLNTYENLSKLNVVFSKDNSLFDKIKEPIDDILNSMKVLNGEQLSEKDVKIELNIEFASNAKKLTNNILDFTESIKELANAANVLNKAHFEGFGKAGAQVSTLYNELDKVSDGTLAKFSTHAKNAEEFVKTINSLDTSKSEGFARATDALIQFTSQLQSMGSMDKFVTAIVDKLVPVITALNTQINEANKTIGNADKAQRQRTSAINNAVSKINSIMNNTLNVEVKKIADDTTIGGPGVEEGTPNLTPGKTSPHPGMGDA